MSEQPNNNGEGSFEEQLSNLRDQLTSTLMLVTGIAVIITWFFSYQCYYAYTESRRALRAMEETQKAITEFKRTNEPQFLEVLQRLRDYSKTHPDLIPILKKYEVYETNAPAKK
ncbi:MAG: hypothetical protein RLY20_2417 [Verrucomicrobiota bacterium]|jgi:hypothetical protein